MPTAREQFITLGVILAVTVLVIGYDLLAIHAWGVNASISRVIRNLFSAYPTLFVATVYWLGILTGHIWMTTE